MKKSLFLFPVKGYDRRMTLALLLILNSHPSFAHPKSPGVACTAIFRSLDSKNESIEQKKRLAPSAAIGSDVKLEADLNGRHFSATEEANGDLFAQIISAPAYTKGSVFRGALDSQGRFSSSEVIDATVYRIECQRDSN